jgi:MFS family permease
MSASTEVQPSVRIARIVLIWVGVAIIAFGAYTMVTTLKPNRIWGLVTWLIGAVILHDAILSPFVVVVGVVLRRTGRRLRGWVLAVVQSAVVLGAVLLSTVLPEIAAKHHGQRNPTVVPFDYVLRLGIVEAALVVVVVAVLLFTLGSRSGRTSVRRQSTNP